jgi:hypothetical protein
MLTPLYMLSNFEQQAQPTGAGCTYRPQLGFSNCTPTVSAISPQHYISISAISPAEPSNPQEGHRAMGLAQLIKHY